jgi:hypothetical protein
MFLGLMGSVIAIVEDEPGILGFVIPMMMVGFVCIFWALSIKKTPSFHQVEISPKGVRVFVPTSVGQTTWEGEWDQVGRIMSNSLHHVLTIDIGLDRIYLGPHLKPIEKDWLHDRMLELRAKHTGTSIGSYAT